MTVTPWQMPVELEAYRDLITNTGGNDVETLMENYLLPGDAGGRLLRTNLPVYLMSCMTGAQIALLRALHAAGLLREPDTGRAADDAGA